MPRVFSRHDLTKVLYETLPQSAKDSIHVNKKVSDIKTTPEGVNVSCSDGTSYSGTIVVGADGAHSMVRSRMRELAIEADSPEVNDEQPFLTTYRCIWIRFPTNASPLLHEGLTTETHGPRAATQLFAGEETGVTGVYERLPAPTRDRIRYTKADEEDLIREWGHLPLLKGDGKVPDFTLADAYRNKVSSGLVSLEEGVVDHWSFDSHIVLTGDSAHKVRNLTISGVIEAERILSIHLPQAAAVTTASLMSYPSPTNSTGSPAPPSHPTVDRFVKRSERIRRRDLRR